MCKILLSDIMSVNQDVTIAGADLYAWINKQANTGGKLVIDMTGVTSLSSVFLNVSIGRIIDELGVNVLKKTVSFTNITQQQANRLSEYLNKYSTPQR